MNKGKFCSEHFSMNCPLCSDNPEPQKISPPIPFVSPHLPKEPVPLLEPQDFIPEPLPQLFSYRSEESKAVLSITDQYAKSCDEYAEAVNAVTIIENHIEKLQAMKLTLQADVVGKKTQKEELKKKVLETLNEKED